MDASTDRIDTTEQKTAGNPGGTGRDAKGRFGKGNRGGPGNPFTRQTARLRQAALDAVSDDDIRDVIATLKEKAKAGDVAAIKLLLSYSVGKPTAAADPDTLDQHELATMTKNHVANFEGINGIIEGMPAEALLLMLRAMLPELFKSKLQTAAVILSQPIDNDDDDDVTTANTPASQAEAAGPNESAAAAGQNPMADNIPDWMHEIVKADKAASEQQASQNSRQAEPSASGAIEAQQLDALQKQLQDLLDEVKAGFGTGSQDMGMRLRSERTMTNGKHVMGVRPSANGTGCRDDHRLETEGNGGDEPDEA